MSKMFATWMVSLVSATWAVGSVRAAERRISLDEYRNRMKAAWIGQMAGVAWGAPTEFNFRDFIGPANRVVPWRPEMINDAFRQDDLYVEMTFLKTLDDYGLGVSIRQAGIDFANTKFGLWCANAEGRNNLRRGIAPPDCSNPAFHRRANDIDYQIEADYAGIVSPGCPNGVIRLSHVFGRLMNYGDGVWAGAFMGGMYAEAYFETDRVKIVEAGLRCIPAECDYAKIVRTMLADYRADPKDWEKAWRNVTGRCRRDPAYQRDSNGPIDVRVNGAMTLLGFLWGNGDLDKTIAISMRGGYDSDCNPSSAAGVLFTTVGAKKLPAKFTSALSMTNRFLHTSYDMPGLLAASEKITRQIVVAEGGRIEKDKAGKEWFVLPGAAPKPDAYRPSWLPEPPVGSRFTSEEMKKITEKPAVADGGTHAFACCGVDLLGGRREVAVPVGGMARIPLGSLDLNGEGARVIEKMSAEGEPFVAALYVDGVFAGAAEVVSTRPQTVVFDLDKWRFSRHSLELVLTPSGEKGTKAVLHYNRLMGN